MKVTPVIPATQQAPTTENRPAIKMNVNRTIDRSLVLPETIEATATDGTEIGKGGGKPAPTVPETPNPKPESNISDATVQATEAPETNTEPISPQLAAIARQRRSLQLKEKELADREKALSGQTKADLEARLKSEPLSVLQEHGVTYDQLTQEILGNKTNPEIEKLKAEIAELKSGVDKRFSDSQMAQESHAINYVADKLDNLLANGEEFELLKLAEGEEEVVRRVYSHWKKTGKELDVAQVAREYQEELAEEASRYAKLGMVQKRLTPSEPAQTAQEAPEKQPILKTITNKDSARPAVDRRQRAMLAFQGQLKR